MYVCIKCNKVYEKRHAYIGHCSCHYESKFQKRDKYKIRNMVHAEQSQCPYCNKQFSFYGIASHIRLAHIKKNTHDPSIGYANGSRVTWNKGLTKETDDRVLKNTTNATITTRNQVKNGTYIKRGWATWTDEYRDRQSRRMSNFNVSTSVKWYDVNGIKVQGTWERDFAIELVNNNLEWNRYKTFIYLDNGIKRRYRPDFYLPQFNIFIEIKGYWWNSDKSKMRLIFKQHKGLRKQLIIINKRIYDALMFDKSNFCVLLNNIILARLF